MPCFNISWLSNDLYLFTYVFLGKLVSFPFFQSKSPFGGGGGGGGGVSL